MTLVLMATAAEVPPSMGTTSGELAAKASDGAERLDPTRLATAVMVLVIEIAIYRAGLYVAPNSTCRWLRGCSLGKVVSRLFSPHRDDEGCHRIRCARSEGEG